MREEQKVEEEEEEEKEEKAVLFPGEFFDCNRYRPLLKPEKHFFLLPSSSSSSWHPQGCQFRFLKTQSKKTAGLPNIWPIFCPKKQKLVAFSFFKDIFLFTIYFVLCSPGNAAFFSSSFLPSFRLSEAIIFYVFPSSSSFLLPLPKLLLPSDSFRVEGGLTSLFFLHTWLTRGVTGCNICFLTCSKKTQKAAFYCFIVISSPKKFYG